MTNRIVETSDGGFTLEDLTEVSHNIFSVGGGSPALQTGAMVHMANPGVTDYDYNNVPFNAVDYDSDGFWDADNNQMLVPAGLGGLYLVQAGVYVGASGAIDGAVFEITLNHTEWNYDPLLFDLVKVIAAGANDWRGSYAMAVHMADDCASQLDGYATPYRPTRTINLQGGLGCYFAIWRLGDLGYD